MGVGKTLFPLWFQQEGRSALLRGCISTSVGQLPTAVGPLYTALAAAWRELGLPMFYLACIVFLKIDPTF